MVPYGVRVLCDKFMFGQEVYISDIPPAVEVVYGNIPPNTSRWYITNIHRLDMVYILSTMLLWKQQKDIHLIKNST